MTTIVVVRKGDRAAIAADSLTTFVITPPAPHHDPSPQNTAVYPRFPSSAWPAAPRTSWCSRTSSRAMPTSTSTARTRSTRPSGVHPILKDEAFLNPKEEDDYDESSQMTLMIANPAGIFAVYSMREVFEFDRFWAIGSGRDFALGSMFATYAKAKSVEAVAKLAIEAGAEFDTGTSLPMDLRTVTLAA